MLTKYIAAYNHIKLNGFILDSCYDSHIIYPATYQFKNLFDYLKFKHKLKREYDFVKILKTNNPIIINYNFKL